MGDIQEGEPPHLLLLTSLAWEGELSKTPSNMQGFQEGKPQLPHSGVWAYVLPPPPTPACRTSCIMHPQYKGTGPLLPLFLQLNNELSKPHCSMLRLHKGARVHLLVAVVPHCAPPHTHTHAE